MLEGAADAAAKRTNLILALGATIGIVLAVASMMRVGEFAGRLPEDVVADVNGVAIRSVDYLRALNALASDRRSPLTESDRRHVLDRLIDEELLVQYGIDLGLVRSDRRVRGDLVSSVLAAQVASVDGYDPTATELESFYAENGEFFSTPGRLRLATIWVRGVPARTEEQARQRADEVVAALSSGQSFAAVRAQLGDEPVAPLPDAHLPPAKVREYLGPTVTRAAMGLEPGAVSGAIASGSGYYVVQVVDREMQRTPPLSEVEPQVRAEMKRRAGDDAVRATLDRLRVEGDVVSVEDLP